MKGKKRSIGIAAKEIGVETHVIRFWETKFTQIKAEIGRGGRRYYYDKEIDILKKIKKFLYEDGYTISGLQKLLSKNKAGKSDFDSNIILQDDILETDIILKEEDKINIINNISLIEKELNKL